MDFFKKGRVGESHINETVRLRQLLKFMVKLKKEWIIGGEKNDIDNNL